MRESFRVGLTADFFNAAGEVGLGDIGLSLLSDAGIEPERLSEASELTADQVSGFDALLVLTPRVSAATLERAERLAIVARFGVGYDKVDLDACTRHSVAVTTAPDGLRRPVATSALALLLALAHRIPEKDRLTRAGRWGDKLDYMGTGLIGRTLGIVGLGNIGREFCALAEPFGLRRLASDPHVEAADATAAGADLVDLGTLLSESDFVVITAALTETSRGLIDAAALEAMKPTAYLINVARGPIVDQAALTEALRSRRIKGAALDVFEQEPVDPSEPLLALDNVIVTPHGICFTDEFALGTGRSAIGGILEVAAGRAPAHVVNSEVLERPQLWAKLERVAGLAA